MNKKFLISGIIMMILLGSMVMTGCKNDDIFTNINPSWEEDQYKVIEAKYRGTWKTSSDGDGDFHDIILVENNCWFRYNNRYLDFYSDSLGAIAYTDGAKLYASGHTFARSVLGEFTSDTTFRLTEDGKHYLNGISGIDYHKE
jgi:hypothetical protein